jgi:hypothetical protein
MTEYEVDALHAPAGAALHADAMKVGVHWVSEMQLQHVWDCVCDCANQKI